MFKSYININDIPAAFFNYYDLTIPFSVTNRLKHALSLMSRSDLLKHAKLYTRVDINSLSTKTATEIADICIAAGHPLVTLNIHNFKYKDNLAEEFTVLLSLFKSIYKDVRIIAFLDNVPFVLSSFIDSVLNNEVKRNVEIPEIIKWKRTQYEANKVITDAINYLNVENIIFENFFYKENISTEILQLCRFLNEPLTPDILTYHVEHPVNHSCITNRQELCTQLTNTELSSFLR